jgi:hypothetical protein
VRLRIGLRAAEADDACDRVAESPIARLGPLANLDVPAGRA